MIDTQRHDFSSLSVKDLIEAREAYHVHLAHLSQVYATAVGKYLIRHDDANSHDPKHCSNPAELGPRRLDNCEVKDWSWPCVLVFVRHWFTRRKSRKRRPSRATWCHPSFIFRMGGSCRPA